MRRKWEMEHKMLIMILHDILSNMVNASNFRSNNEDRIDSKDHNTFYVNRIITTLVIMIIFWHHICNADIPVPW